MPLAVVALDFDPILRLGGWAVRIDTLVAALGILAALLVAAIVARRTPLPGEEIALAPLTVRLDDLLFVALAALPGAVVGGRLGYVLLHGDYYAAHLSRIADPGQGSLELAGAVAGAALTGGFAARVLTGSAGRWFHVAAIPTLLAIGVGKLAMALGGSGQGQPSSAAWATAYVGPGPWGSLAADVPAVPAQLLEAAATGMLILVVIAFAAAGVFRRRDGLAWLVAIGAWGVARAAIAATWRDPTAVGPLRMGQVIALALVAACLVAFAWLVWRRSAASKAGADPRWPDPETRPHF